jgi:23S rRNA (adenine2030-N6)-methyltransferase
MNYRHQFHAGNFADVMKHALLVRLLQALQRKEKGFLYLDTHAGRGGYDLNRAAVGDSLARKPEWPEGIGRILAQTNLPPEIADYVRLVQDYDRREGNLEPGLRFYPGSPALAGMLARPQDRLMLAELHPGEAAALRDAVGLKRGVSVQEIDGYVAVRAALPPPEKRALVLIDPPFESTTEFSQIGTAMADGLARLPGGTFVIWYPLTGRARADEFFAAIRALRPPATMAAELAIAGEYSGLKMRGCGLVIVNPPWQFQSDTEAVLTYLAGVLAQGPGARGSVEWLVPES